MNKEKVEQLLLQGIQYKDALEEIKSIIDSYYIDRQEPPQSVFSDIYDIIINLKEL